MTEKQDDSYWQRLYNSSIAENTRLKQKILEQQTIIDFLSKQSENAQDAFNINKQIMRDATEDHNKKEKELIAYMNALKEKLREYGFKDFNGLADSVGLE